jgi:hypothetical protein
MKLKAILLAIVVSLPLGAQESRAFPLDIYLIIERGAVTSEQQDSIARYIKGRVIDGIYQEGDNLTILAAGEGGCDVIYADGDSIEAARSAMKEVIDGLEPTEGKGDIAIAFEKLREINGADKKKREKNRLPYTLLICGPEVSMTDPILRKSRTENFARWRVITINIEE